MKTVIVVYSRSGNTLKAAKSLAGTLGAEIVEIRPERHYEGMIGYLRGGFDSVRRRVPRFHLSNRVDPQCELMVLAAPMWAGRPAVPLVAFLEGKPRLPGKVALLLTHGGSGTAKAIAEVEGLVGGRLAASLSLRQADIRADRYEATLAEFARHATAEVQGHMLPRGRAA